MAQHTIGVLLTASTGGFRAQMTAAANSVQGFERSVESSSSKTQTFGQKISNSLRSAVGVRGLIAGFTGAAVAIGYSVRSAAQFEAAMRNVNSISGLSDQALQQMSSSVLNLSTQLPQSATTLAEGLYEIASSGFQGAAGMQVLESSALAASAGLSTTDTAAKAITSVLNAYGLSASHAADVSDVLFQTVNLGVVSFDELASQLGDVVGMAAAAGVEIDEVGAAIAAMTLAGISAAESTTSLNALLRALIDPSDELVGVYDEMDVASGEAALAQFGLYGTMERLRESTGGNVTELMKLFPEIRAARGAFALMSASGENYRKTQEGITNEQERAGATQRAFNEQMEATGNQAKLLGNKIQAAAIQFGTALLPAVQDGMVALENFGSAVGDLMSELGSAAGPAVDALRRALSEVGAVASGVYDALQPVVALLGRAFAGAAIVGLQGLSNALASTAGAIADNEGAIRVLAAVLGGLLLAKLTTAAASAASFAIQFRALLIMETLGPIISNLAGRMGQLGSAFTNMRLGNITGAVSGVSGAFSGLGAVLTSPAFVATAVVGVFMAITSALQDADQYAKEMRAELERDIDITSLDSVNTGLDNMRDRYRELATTFEAEGGRMSRAFQILGEWANPFDNNELTRTGQAMREVGDGIEAMERQAQNTTVFVGNLMATFGLTQNAAEELLESLEFDASADATADAIGRLNSEAEALIYSAQGGTPAMEGVQGAMESVGDAASTAEDQVSAFEDTINSLLGISISAREAEAQLAGAIRDLGDTVTESGIGPSFDVWTEAGHANEAALRDNIEAITELGQATLEETGSVDQAVNSMSLYREQLLNNLTAMGMTRGAAEDLIATYGLTPENLETLVQLRGAEEALGVAEDIGRVMEAIGEAQATGRVNLDTEEFDNDNLRVGEALAQIGMNAPEAVVTLNDEPFQATAEQVAQWAYVFGNDPIKSEALLDIIDPQNDFETLAEAAAGWRESHPEATASLNPFQANAEFDGLFGTSATWGATFSSATADLNPDPANADYAGLFGTSLTWGQRNTSATADLNPAPAQNDYSGLFGTAVTWGQRNTSATADLNPTPAHNDYGGLFGTASDWGTRSDYATAGVNDYASGTLDSIVGKLGRLYDKNITITATYKQVGGPFPKRWGGATMYQGGDVVHAATGYGREATYANSPQVHWAEPETGGEVYIPRLGHRDRSLNFLAMGANWYGMRLVPENDETARYGRITGRDMGSRPYGDYADAARSFAGQIEAQANALGPRLTTLANTSVQNLLVQFGDGLEGLFGQLIPDAGVRSMVTNAMRTSLGSAGVGGGSAVAVDVGGLHVSLSGLAGLDEQQVADKVRGEMKTLVRDLTQQIKALTATRGT